MITRCIRSILTLVVLMLPAALLMSPGVEAREARPATAAVTCYGQAVSFPERVLTPGLHLYPTNSWLVTSHFCRDINIKFHKLSHPVAVRVCFQRTETCNSWKVITFKNRWYPIATHVLDGTRYKIDIRANYKRTLIGGWIAD